MNFLFGRPTVGMLPADQCPPGRDTEIPDAPGPDTVHYLSKNRLRPPYPEGHETMMVGMGCFWCSENIFAQVKGVYATMVGYAGGVTQNPTYREVCTGTTNHNEVTRIVFDPEQVSYGDLLKLYWSTHDPTIPFGQGNDRGTQYRSGLYTYSEEQQQVAEQTRDEYQGAIDAAGLGKQIVTEILPAPEFFWGEEDHQQYDAKPGNRQYCGLRPLGVGYPKSK
jgi:peptide-methionine (S)-S-oxide reductase